MKKILVLFVFGLFLICGSVFAGYSLPSVVYNDTIIQCTNTPQGALGFNSTINALIVEPSFFCFNGDDTWDNLFSIPIEEMINVNRIVNWNGQDPPNCSQMTYTQCKNHASFLSEYVVSFINTPTPPPIGISILGGTAPSVGTPFDGNEMVSQLTARVGMTMDGVAPLLAVVVGIFLCMIIISKITGLFDEVKEEEYKHEVIDIPDISQVKEKFYNWNK